MSELEQVVSLMMNSTNSATNQGGKMSCWPDESSSFRVNGRNWREAIHDLVAITRFDNPRRYSAGEVQPATLTTPYSLELYSPVVSLCDVLKPQQTTDKHQFLDYFKLSTSTLSQTSTNNKYCTSHPRTLVNCPHIPFSSNIGLKLIKDWHSIPEETHIKKLERLERYLSTSLEQKPPNETEYEITYNKNVNDSHFYIFPTKSYHRKTKLSPKARHLFKKYCRPCTVRLSVISTVPTTSKTLQKENVQARFEPKIILTNYFPVVHKENSGRPFLKELRPRKNNTVLKTLEPRNQNARAIVETREAMCENLINASVILPPINTFFRPAPPKKLRNKIRSMASNFFSVRRISPRLNIRNKPLKIL